MAVEIPLIDELSAVRPFDGPAAAGVFDRQGWRPMGRNSGGEYESTWASGDERDTRAWIQAFPDHVRVEVIVWMHDVDEEVRGGDEGLDWLYDKAENLLPEFASEFAAAFADDATPIEFSDEFEEFIGFRAWSLRERTVILGAKQDDTDTPVFVVFSVR